jgi:hypothetical protein
LKVRSRLVLKKVCSVYGEAIEDVSNLRQWVGCVMAVIELLGRSKVRAVWATRMLSGVSKRAGGGGGGNPPQSWPPKRRGGERLRAQVLIWF